MADWITNISNKLSPTKSPKLVITTTKSIYIDSDDSFRQLKAQSMECGWPLTESLFKRRYSRHKYLQHHSRRSWEWTTTGSKLEQFRWFLHVESMDITLPLSKVLVPALDFPPCAATTEEPDKWDGVDFDHCSYSLRYDERRHASSSIDPMLEWTCGGRCCACSRRFLEVHSDELGTMLASRNKSLILIESPEILSRLLTEHELESPRFFLDQSSLTPLDCKRLGSLVERSRQLKYLTLHLSNLVEPQMLAESMGKAIHLEELTIKDGSNRPSMHEEQPRQTLADAFVRPGGNDIVGRLLQNSQSCLKMLCLHSMQLDDCHFMVIVDALPTSQLEDVDVSNNNIQCQGILSFAAQLCKNKTLTRVNLARNPWEDDWDVENETCWEALQQGLAENYNI